MERLVSQNSVEKNQSKGGTASCQGIATGYMKSKQLFASASNEYLKRLGDALNPCSLYRRKNCQRRSLKILLPWRQREV